MIAFFIGGGSTVAYPASLFFLFAVVYLVVMCVAIVIGSSRKDGP